VDPDLVLTLVEAHLVTELGEDSGRASVTFLGAERIDVLRFGPDGTGVWRYATVGMARAPMADPGSYDTSTGPRAELLLSVQGPQDSVARRLAALAAAPSVEGVVVAPGATLDLQEPIWDGARFTAVLVAVPGGQVVDLGLDGADEAVRFLPLLPMTAEEAAFTRVKGAADIERRWLDQGLDLRDPRRSAASLT